MLFLIILICNPQLRWGSNKYIYRDDLKNIIILNATYIQRQVVDDFAQGSTMYVIEEIISTLDHLYDNRGKIYGRETWRCR